MEKRLGILSRVPRSPIAGSIVRVDLHQDAWGHAWDRWKPRWACLSDPIHLPGVFQHNFSIFGAIDDAIKYVLRGESFGPTLWSSIQVAARLLVQGMRRNRHRVVHLLLRAFRPVGCLGGHGGRSTAGDRRAKSRRRRGTDIRPNGPCSCSGSSREEHRSEAGWSARAFRKLWYQFRCEIQCSTYPDANEKITPPRFSTRVGDVDGIVPAVGIPIPRLRIAWITG